MSTAKYQANQRKRKLDPPSNVQSKRRRSSEAPNEAAGEHQQSSLSQHPRPLDITMHEDSTMLSDPEACDSQSDPRDYLHSEGALSKSELSSETETSSDSGISSSDSEDEDKDEHGDSEHDSSIGSDSDRDMIALRAPIKPSISSATATSGSLDLRSRIASFLPQLRKANEDLSTNDDQRLDAVASDEDRYIEMDLGLGVLKEKKRPRPLYGEIQTHKSSGGGGGSSSSSDSSSDDESETEVSPVDAMDELTGRKEKGRRSGRPVIQAFDET